jgi:hypothetical protein
VEILRPALSKYFRLSLQRQECLLVVAWDNLALCNPLQMLESLRTPEPGWMISSEPSLWDAVSPLPHVSLILKEGRPWKTNKAHLHFQ